jgi:hypothetical protein
MSNKFFEELESLRLPLDGTTDAAGVQEVLSQVPVGRRGPVDFFRIHPDPNMSLLTTIYEDKATRETFFVAPNMREALLEQAKPRLIVTGTTTRRVIFLWPLTVPEEMGRGNPWHSTAWQAYELAKTNWTRMASDRHLQAYRIYQAEGQLPEPDWPNKTLSELLEIAFRGRIIDVEDHPIIKQIRGLA